MYTFRHAEVIRVPLKLLPQAWGAVVAQAGAGLDLQKPAVVEGDEKLLTDAEDMDC